MNLIIYNTKHPDLNIEFYKIKIGIYIMGNNV